MNGALILVSGLSGAGKSTMIAGALHALPELLYIKTYTTRPRRAGEENNHEYVFVTDKQYDEHRQASTEWDHTEYAGFKYGADAGAYKAALAAHTNVLCSVAPDISVISDMATLYGISPITVWIETPKQLVDQRVKSDNLRASRIEDSAVRHNFDKIFEPIGDVDVDTISFSDLILSLCK